MYLVFLDEFGHIGPFVSRHDPQYHTSPVFGLAGFSIHHSKVRDLSHWFYKRKAESFATEIAQAGAHPSYWEKKGNELFTRGRVYMTKRKGFELLNQLHNMGAKVIYNGIEKYFEERLNRITIRSRIVYCK